jgi:hypothetical protein
MGWVSIHLTSRGQLESLRANVLAFVCMQNQTNSIACSDTDIPSSSECTNKILHHKTQYVVRERRKAKPGYHCYSDHRYNTCYKGGNYVKIDRLGLTPVNLKSRRFLCTG